MTRKTTRRTTSRSSRPRATGRRRKSSSTRLTAVVLGFVVLTGLLLYGMYYLNNELSLSSRINKVDDSLYEVLFKLSVSSRDILKETTEEKSKDGVTWNVKKQSIKLKRRYSEDEIRKAFEPLTELKGVSFSTRSEGGYHSSKINVDGYTTHVFDFIGENDLGRKPRISIIVDDVGINKHVVDSLIDISKDLTFAILPNRPFSRYAARQAGKNNIDVLLHQPMEPRIDSGYTADDAGEGVLLVGQTKKDILAILNRNLSSVPNAVGVNNHMGSKFTQNDELMRLVLARLKEKDLFFVDSLTTSGSKGYVIAKELGMNAARRDIFLDDRRKGKDYIRKQLRKLVRKAKKNGYSVGICHTYPQTIEVMREELDNISKEVNILPISKLIKQKRFM